MRKATIVAVCLLGLGTVVPSTASASAQDDVFRGFWTSVDHDGSHQTLTVQGSGRAGHHAMRYFDDAATGELCGGTKAHIQGSGTVDGDNLHMRGVLTCQPGGNPLHQRIDVGYVYDSATDTLIDDSGVTWSRA